MDGEGREEGRRLNPLRWDDGGGDDDDGAMHPTDDVGSSPPTASGCLWNEPFNGDDQKNKFLLKLLPLKDRLEHFWMKNPLSCPERCSFP